MGETEDTRYDENGYLKDEIGDFNFDKKFTIFIWKDSPYIEFSTEEISGNNVADTNYKRNLTVASRTCVNLEFIYENGESSKRDAFVNKLKTTLESGNDSVDLVGTYSMTCGLATLQGLYSDLSLSDKLEWEKPWWPDSIMSTCKINGKLYFASGDVSLNSITAMYTTFFNKKMVEDLKLENPYTIVKEGKWTLEKMWEMCKGCYRDVNGDGKFDFSDSYGFVMQKYNADAFMLSSNITFLKNSEGTVVLSDDFSGERGDAVMSLITKIAADPTSVYFYNSDDVDSPRENFASGLSLFWTDATIGAMKINDGNLSYGMVPTPKGSADQEKYYTGSGFNITFFSIPYNVTDLNCSAAVLEILASESYRSTTPALFENDFKCRYSQDAEASEMFDMLRENVIYDVGRVFSAQFNHPYNLVRSTVNTGTSWATTAKASQKVWKTNLSSMLKSFD